MTVGELIAELQKVPAAQLVLVDGYEFGFDPAYIHEIDVVAVEAGSYSGDYGRAEGVDPDGRDDFGRLVTDSTPVRVLLISRSDVHPDD